MSHLLIHRGAPPARGAGACLRAGRAFLVVSAPLAGCLPEQPLASYRSGDSVPAVSSAVSSPPPDAAERLDGGALDAAAPGEAVPVDAAPGLDAAAPGAGLLCRDDCVCERDGDREFMFCAALASHDEAVARCAAAGGALPSIDDPALGAWLSARMADLDADDFWLSGTDIEDEGVWRWGDGRVFFDPSADAATAAFAPWDEGQPNNLNGEDCMRSTGGVWRDLDCSEQIAVVCQG